jgi:hypothetical protein
MKETEKGKEKGTEIATVTGRESEKETEKGKEDRTPFSHPMIRRKDVVTVGLPLTMADEN